MPVFSTAADGRTSETKEEVDRKWWEKDHGEISWHEVNDL